METGTLIELDCTADFWNTPDDNGPGDDRVGLLHDGDWLIFLGIVPFEHAVKHEDSCDLAQVISRFGVGYINAVEIPAFRK
jgi:hypothetical protein